MREATITCHDCQQTLPTVILTQNVTVLSAAYALTQKMKDHGWGLIDVSQYQGQVDPHTLRVPLCPDCLSQFVAKRGDQ